MMQSCKKPLESFTCVAGITLFKWCENRRSPLLVSISTARCMVLAEQTDTMSKQGRYMPARRWQHPVQLPSTGMPWMRTCGCLAAVQTAPPVSGPRTHYPAYPARDASAHINACEGPAACLHHVAVWCTFVIFWQNRKTAKLSYWVMYSRSTKLCSVEIIVPVNRYPTNIPNRTNTYVQLVQHYVLVRYMCSTSMAAVDLHQWICVLQ